MSQDVKPEARILRREPHKLPPQRWRLIVIVTDTPAPGQGYISKDDVQAEVVRAMDGMADGLGVEIGAVEKAAQGS